MRGEALNGRDPKVRRLSFTTLAVALALGTAPAAYAVGFGPVRSLSPATGIVDQIAVAVAPTGETAVMWRQGGPDDFQFVAAIGRDAENLGPARPVEPARGAASRAAGARLLARPAGGFVACFHAGDRRADAFGCSFTDESGTFGPLRVVERRSFRDDPSQQVAMRSDGKLAILLRHRVAPGRLRLRTTTLDDQGRLGPIRPLATVLRGGSASLATTDDGVTGVMLTEPRRRDQGRIGRPSLRLTASGQDVFGAAKSFLPNGAAKPLESARLDGGRELRMTASVLDDSIGGDLIVRRRPNGAFSAPLRLPRPAPGFLGGTVVVPPGGTPFAITAATRESQTDCSDVSAGVVGSGPLVSRRTTSRTTTTQRLSKPGQIAFQPTAATLADGTVIAAWENGVTDGGDTRLEVAIRPSGATRFGPSQVLPELATWGMDLAAGGDQAILAWMVGDHVDGPSHVVVSSLRQEPPYAPPAKLPRRPRMPCQ